MLRFRCPARPADFDTSVCAARQAIQDKLDRGEALTSRDFDHSWGKYKQHFVDAQHGKCGYCEFDIAGNNYGDVDHYAPKARYPNLAYIWENYVYACDFCNRTHKGEKFPTVPVRPGTGWRGVVELDTGDVALLLNPYEQDTNPADHLAYDPLGQIQARAGSNRGWHTIQVCGLDREWLRTKREPEARLAYLWTMELEDALARDDRHDIDRVLDVIERAGAASRRFAGMVRAIFEHEMGSSWDETFPEPD